MLFFVFSQASANCEGGMKLKSYVKGWARKKNSFFKIKNSL